MDEAAASANEDNEEVQGESQDSVESLLTGADKFTTMKQKCTFVKDKFIESLE